MSTHHDDDDDATTAAMLDDSSSDSSIDQDWVELKQSYDSSGVLPKVVQTFKHTFTLRIVPLHSKLFGNYKVHVKQQDEVKSMLPGLKPKLFSHPSSIRLHHQSTYNVTLYHTSAQHSQYVLKSLRIDNDACAAAPGDANDTDLEALLLQQVPHLCCRWRPSAALPSTGPGERRMLMLELHLQRPRAVAGERARVERLAAHCRASANDERSDDEELVLRVPVQCKVHHGDDKRTLKGHELRAVQLAFDIVTLAPAQPIYEV